MQTLFNQLRQKLSKPILFGLYGAMGCLLATILLGEPLLALTKLPPSIQQTPQAVVLLIDASGSMSDGKLDEVKSAAIGFVQRRDLSQDRLAVIGFGRTVNTTSSLTANPNTLQSAIASLSYRGGTPMAQGIQAAVAELQSTSLNRNILLFTDGAPDSQTFTSIAAQSARNRNVNIVAVATGDADTNYLAKLTGDPSLVFYASSGDFDQAFRDAEAVIFGKQLVESEPTGDYGLVYATLRIGGWTALLAIGISFALIIGQNHYMRRRLLTSREGSLSTGGSLTAGLMAGSVGQLLFLPVTSIPNAGVIEGAINWTLAGAILGGGLSFFLPTLKLYQGFLGGSISGALGAGGLLLTANFLGDFLGRLVGALVFGLSISRMAGCLVALGATVAAFVVGQSLFLPIAGISTLDVIGRIVGWAILGTLVGGGTSLFVPNLKLSRALFGGSVGGTLGATGFLMAAAVFGDLPGRLTGAGILGFCIGLMIAWAENEQLSTQAYLLVRWTPSEQTKILLGRKPVLLGSSANAHVYLRQDQGYPLVTAKIYQEGETVVLEFDQDYRRTKKDEKTHPGTRRRCDPQTRRRSPRSENVY
jgi:Ca-activated chloride channel family protein